VWGDTSRTSCSSLKSARSVSFVSCQQNKEHKEEKMKTHHPPASALTPLQRVPPTNRPLAAREHWHAGVHHAHDPRDHPRPPLPSALCAIKGVRSRRAHTRSAMQLPALTGGANRLFQLPWCVPKVTGFRRAPVKFKDWRNEI